MLQMSREAGDCAKRMRLNKEKRNKKWKQEIESYTGQTIFDSVSEEGLRRLREKPRACLFLSFFLSSLGDKKVTRAQLRSRIFRHKLQ
jgi:hypothetical protein